MKVLLIFPPLWATHRPYLSLPSLSAYLRNHGIEVVQKDFNIEAYDLLLSQSNLKKVSERLNRRFEALEAKENLASGMEQRYYCDLFKAKSNAGYIAGQIENAKRVLRSETQFYNLEALTQAKSILNLAQDIISVDCYPTGGDLIWPNNVRFQRSLDDIKSITLSSSENPFIDLYEQHLLPYISGQASDLIGISITGERQLIPALTLSRMIKLQHKNAHVVVGGYVVTLLSEVLMKYEELFGTFFDSAIVYEGERPLLKLAESLSQGQDLDDVPNLIYRREGKICANEVMPPEDINSLPTPSFDELPMDLYLSPEPVLPVLSSRGCYWGKCAFCPHNESYQLAYQNRTAAKVADDMQELTHKYGVTHFAFSDEAISPAAIGRISDEIIKRRMKVRCSTNVRLERQFSPELCRKMYDAGFRLLYLGLESGCNRVLKHMEKGITKETAAEVCKNTCQAGICNHLYVFFGFPTETQAEAQETVDFLLANKDVIHSFGITNFILNKGSAAMSEPGRFGISGIDTNSGTEFTLDYAYNVSTGLRSREAQQLSNVSRDRISREFKYRDRLNLYYEDILLYLSHYEMSDPHLCALKSAGVAEARALSLIGLQTVPALKPNVIPSTLRFNIIEIITQNIIAKRDAETYPDQTHVLFDPASGKLISIDPLSVQVLKLCNGQNSVERIVDRLSVYYGVDAGELRQECTDAVRYLVTEGYLNTLTAP